MRVVRFVVLFALGVASHASAIDFRRLTDCCPYDPDVTLLQDPALSPDGSRVAYTNDSVWPPWYEWWPYVAVLPIDGGAGFGVQSRFWNSWTFAPAWSPDGGRLAFAVGGYDYPSNGIWSVDVSAPQDSASYLQIVAGEIFAWEIAWSRDGTTLAFHSGGRLWTVPSTGGTPADLGIVGASPTWGPSGELAYERGGDLWIREADGQERRLTSTPDADREPSWSPDGTWIAFHSNRSGNWDVWVIASTGGTPVRLTDDPADDTSPSWGDHGRALVFVSTRGTGHTNLWLATDLPDFTIGVQATSWSAVKQLYR